MNRITLEKQNAIRELYLKGYNDKLIADVIGVSVNTVKEYKRRYNIKLTIKKLYYKEKKRIKDICEELNLNPNQVRSYLNKIEIEELRKKRR